jgi:hypothetical protein
MIDKSGEYWHLYFCENIVFDDKTFVNPEAILLFTIKKLFEEISEMGDVWLMRAAPTIEYFNEFDGKTRVQIFCRFSSLPPKPKEIPELLGFGKKESA